LDDDVYLERARNLRVRREEAAAAAAAEASKAAPPASDALLGLLDDGELSVGSAASASDSDGGWLDLPGV
jgi:hypothetical protein